MLLAGYQCFVPSIDSNAFELTGHASHAGTVEILVVSHTGIQSMLRTTNADGNWASGALSELDGFTNGTTIAKVRLISNGQAGAMQSVPATQCAGTGLEVDSGLQSTMLCYMNPSQIYLYGRLSEYGVVFARHVQDGAVTSIINPQLDGMQDPVNPSVTWSGILKDATTASPHTWLSTISMVPYIGSVASYNAGETGALELRLQTPDNRSSAWIPVEQLVDC